MIKLAEVEEEKQNRVDGGQDENIETAEMQEQNKKEYKKGAQWVPWNLFESLHIGVEEDDGPEAAKLRLVHRHLLHLCHQLHQHSAKENIMLYPFQGFPECLQVFFEFGVQNSKDVHYIAL